MDGFFVAKLKVGRPQKGAARRAADSEDGKKAGAGEVNGMDVDEEVAFNDDEDKPYLEGQLRFIAYWYNV